MTQPPDPATRGTHLDPAGVAAVPPSATEAPAPPPPPGGRCNHACPYPGCGATAAVEASETAETSPGSPEHRTGGHDTVGGAETAIVRREGIPDEAAEAAEAAMSAAFRTYTGTSVGEAMWNLNMEKTWTLVAPACLAAAQPWIAAATLRKAAPDTNCRDDCDAPGSQPHGGNISSPAAGILAGRVGISDETVEAFERGLGNCTGRCCFRAGLAAARSHLLRDVAETPAEALRQLLADVAEILRTRAAARLDRPGWTDAHRAGVLEAIGWLHEICQGLDHAEQVGESR